MMKGKPLVSVVIGTYNRAKFLKLAIVSVRSDLRGCSHEIIVVDGGSTDGTIQWLVKQKDIITIVQHNRGFWRGEEVRRRSWGYFMNLGFRAAQGRFICMLSDDCLLVPGAISNGVRLFEERLASGEKVGALAFYWRNWPEQKDYWVGQTLGDKLFVNHGLYLKNALDVIGYADEDTYVFYYADGDLCLKLWQAGYRCEASPESFVEHFSHANLEVRSSNLSVRIEDRARYHKKWEGVFFHPELENIGGWHTKSFYDAAETAKRFIRGDILGWYFKRPLSMIMKHLSGGRPT